jgi:hypothetical protein
LVVKKHRSESPFAAIFVFEYKQFSKGGIKGGFRIHIFTRKSNSFVWKFPAGKTVGYLIIAVSINGSMNDFQIPDFVISYSVIPGMNKK